MADTRAAKLRSLWLNVHLWIGVGLAALLIPISISGALLVLHDEIDARFNPHRYAVTGTRAALPPTVYLSKAAEAVAKDPTGLRASAETPSRESGRTRLGVRRGVSCEILDARAGLGCRSYNEKSYIVPGLGDAGDRLFGTK